MSITITEKAAKHVNDHLVSRGTGIGLRLGVKTTGCSGLAYVIEFADKVESDDKVFEDNGIKIIVDDKSFLYLIGTTLEYSGGLNGKGFVFNNPNASRTCGCGESFSL